MGGGGELFLMTEEKVRAWQIVFRVQKENMMPELSTPLLRLSQERIPASRREVRSTPGEMMSARKRVREEVKVMTREARERIAIRRLMASLAMFLEHQGTGGLEVE